MDKPIKQTNTDLLIKRYESIAKGDIKVGIFSDTHNIYVEDSNAKYKVFHNGSPINIDSVELKSIQTLSEVLKKGLDNSDVTDLLINIAYKKKK